jgi:hypothetical protein
MSGCGLIPQLFFRKMPVGPSAEIFVPAWLAKC